MDFQPLPSSQLKRLLPSAADEEFEKPKEKDTAVSKDKERAASTSAALTSGAVMGNRSYRMATAGGDSKVRVSGVTPFV